jgi:hypothetical protein
MFNSQLFKTIIKYSLMGGAVALAAKYIPSRGQMEMQELLILALTTAAIFLVLDTFAPSVGMGARSGAGFGIGANTVGFKLGGVSAPAVTAAAASIEPMENDLDNYSY